MNLTLECSPFLNKLINGDDDVISNHSYNKLLAPLLQDWESLKLTELVNSICQIANETRFPNSTHLPDTTIDNGTNSNFEFNQSVTSNCSANR